MFGFNCHSSSSLKTNEKLYLSRSKSLSIQSDKFEVWKHFNQERHEKCATVPPQKRNLVMQFSAFNPEEKTVGPASILLSFLNYEATKIMFDCITQLPALYVSRNIST